MKLFTKFIYTTKHSHLLNYFTIIINQLPICGTGVDVGVIVVISVDNL